MGEAQALELRERGEEVINAALVRYGFETLIVIEVFLMMFYSISIFIAAVAIAVIALFTNGTD